MTFGFSIKKIVAVGITGWVGGILTERYRNEESFNFLNIDLSKLQIFRSLRAASLVNKDSTTNLPSKDVVDSWFMEHPKETRVSQIMRYGFPGLDNIKSYEDFVISYDKRNRVPHWVFEHLTRYSVKFNKEVDRSKCEFYEDNSTHHFFRSTNLDYKGSGYDRGHMAAAGNHRLDQTHCQETFVLSNMAPQVGKGFNRDSWNRLEKHVRGLTKSHTNVYVCTGPLYLPRREPNGRNYVKYEVIGSNNVAVPTHFFKVVVGETPNGQFDMESYIMPNEPIDDKAPLYAFQVPVEAIERASGLLLFDKLQRTSFRSVNGRKYG